MNQLSAQNFWGSHESVTPLGAPGSARVILSFFGAVKQNEPGENDMSIALIAELKVVDPKSLNNEVLHRIPHLMMVARMRLEMNQGGK